MKNAKTALNLTEGRPVKLILLFAIPVFLGNLFQICYSLVDTKIVGRILGETALAAVGSVSVLYTLLTGFFNGLSLGFSVLTARFYGSGEERRLKENVAGAIVLGFLTAGVLVTGIAVFIRPILTLLHVPPQQLEMALSYITLLVWGMFVTLAYNLCANTLRAIGDSVTPLVFGDCGGGKCCAGLRVYPRFSHGSKRRRSGDAGFADAVSRALPASDSTGISDTAPFKGAFCAFKGAGALLIRKRTFHGADVKPCEFRFAGASKRHQPARDEYHRGAHRSAQGV